MTQYIEPNKKSDLIDLSADGNSGVLAWLQSLRTGKLSGFTVTPGSMGGFLLTVAGGKAVIKGTTIHDDLTRENADLLGLVGPLGSNAHAMIWAQYIRTDTFPPATMTVGSTIHYGSPPSPPALDTCQIKLADVFIPSGSSDLSSAVIVNSPTIPGLGNNDTDVLIERLTNANANIFVGGGGVMALDAGDFTWSSDIYLYSSVTTHKEKYMSAPLSVGRIVPGTLSGVGSDAIIFTVFDRRGPTNSTLSLTAYVLDLSSPDPAAMNLFFNPATRDQIIWVAMISSGQIVPRGGLGVSLPPPAGLAPPYRFLMQDPNGGPENVWEPVTDDKIVDILAVDQFSADTPTLETGSLAAYPTFTAHVVNDEGTGPVYAHLKSALPVEDTDVLAGFGGTSSGAFASTRTTTGGVAGSNVIYTYTLEARKQTMTLAQAQTTIQFWRRTYCGFSATDPGAGNYDDTFLRGLGNNPLAEGRAISIVLGAPAGPEYLFLAYPAWKGEITKIVDELTGLVVTGAFSQVDAAQAGITTENVNAIPEDYRVYRSNQPQTGAVSITVS